MKRKIKVSVIMSVFNENEKWLKESIYSILNQSFTDFEFIVVNDNPSNKAIERLLESIYDQRLTIVNNIENKGLVYSLNKALNIANGEYIVRMDADDIAFKNRIEKQIKYLEENNLDMIGCSEIVINEDGEQIREYILPTNERKIVGYSYCGEDKIPHPCWLVRKEVYDKLNRYRNIKFCEDFDFILRAIKNNIKVGNCNEFLLKYRVRENSISNTNRKKQYWTANYLAKNIKNISSITEDEISYAYEKEKKGFELFYNVFIDRKRKIKLSYFFNINFCKYTIYELIRYIRIAIVKIIYE